MTKILIVDDIEANRYLLTSLLTGNGYEVGCATNGADALALAQASPPDLIVTDILMPVMDGFELCRRCKLDARLRHVPIIVYTATYADPKDEQLALGMGVHRYLIKPQPPELLVQVVRDVLDEAARGTVREPSREAAELLRLHNDALVEKLGKKVRELETKIIQRDQLLTALRESTDRTRLAQTAMRELEAFSYSVSHDLRAPLRRIDGFSQALLEDHAGALDEKGKNYLRRIRESSQHMVRLVDDLLSLALVTSGDLHRARVDLTALVHRIAGDLQASEPRRTVSFVIAEAIHADGDARLLDVLLENLMGNAWKFTARRDQARIEFGRTEDPGQAAYFVRDNGAGFDMSHADKLFVAFQRLHPSSEFAGTGIGLATVQRIVRRHGGQVWADGQVDRGATFYFTLGE